MNKSNDQYANFNTDFINKIEGISDSDRYTLKRMFETGIQRAIKDEKIRCVMIMQKAMDEMRGARDG
jgi:hypothetical protein